MSSKLILKLLVLEFGAAWFWIVHQQTTACTNPPKHFLHPNPQHWHSTGTHSELQHHHKLCWWHQSLWGRRTFLSVSAKTKSWISGSRMRLITSFMLAEMLWTRSAASGSLVSPFAPTSIKQSSGSCLQKGSPTSWLSQATEKCPPPSSPAFTGVLRSLSSLE